MFVYMFNRQGETEAETVKIRFCGQSGGKRRSHLSGEFQSAFTDFSRLPVNQTLTQYVSYICCYSIHSNSNYPLSNCLPVISVLKYFALDH